MLPLVVSDNTVEGKVGKPLFAAVQFNPLLVDTNKPPTATEAKREVPTTAIRTTSALAGKPLLSGIQFAPLSGEKRTPPKEVPTNISVPIKAIE